MKKKGTYLALILGIVFTYPLLYQPVHGVLDHSLSSHHHCCDEIPAENDGELLTPCEHCAVCEYEIAAFSNSGTFELPEITLSFYVSQSSPVKGYLTTGAALLPDPRGPPQM